MIKATNQMRQAYLMASLDVKLKIVSEPFVSRAYADEKIRRAFSAETEDELLGSLDITRRTLYSRYYQELLNGRTPR